MYKWPIYALILFNSIIGNVKKTIIESTEQKLVLRIDILAKTESDLYSTKLLIGLPSSNIPKVNVQYSQKDIIPFETDQFEIKKFDWINQQKVKKLETATLIIYPFATKNEYYRSILVEIIFDKSKTKHIKANSETSKFLKNRVLNWDIAQNWIQKKISSEASRIVEEAGYWFNFFLDKDDIYFIDQSTLNSNINMSNVDPRSISLFMHKNLGRSKSRAFHQSIEPNLIEIPIVIEGEEDGSFDPSDKIIFFGHGSSGYDISNDNLDWKQNLYYDQNSCWIFIPNDNSRRGKRITNTLQPNEGTLIDYGMVCFHIEPDLINLEASGIEWLWSSISSGNAQRVELIFRLKLSSKETT